MRLPCLGTDTAREFIQSLGTQLTGKASTFVELRQRELRDRYYCTRKRNRGKRGPTIGKAFQGHLTGCYAGDWLAFLDVIGEEPQPDDILVTELPKATVRLTDFSRIQEAADRLGIAYSDVAAALGSDADDRSPIPRRVAIMKTFWSCLHELHSTQTSDAGALYGLVEDGRRQPLILRPAEKTRDPYRQQLFATVLPLKLLSDIDQCWGTTVLGDRTEYVVSSISPHREFSDAFGPALQFWHGVSLGVWFCCMGPSSRTDIAGLQAYHHKQLAQLKPLHRVNETLFSDLIAADTSKRRENGSGWKLFCVLRDLVTMHRKQWEDKHLDSYLRSRWESELLDCGETISRHIANFGYPPPADSVELRNKTVVAARHWFGGHLSGVYRALSEPYPVSQKLVKLMPSDRVAFVMAIYKDIEQLIVDSDISDREQFDGLWAAEWVSNQMLRYVQGLEAGKTLTPKQLGCDNYLRYLSVAFRVENDDVWQLIVGFVAKRLR